MLKKWIPNSVEKMDQKLRGVGEVVNKGRKSISRRTHDSVQRTASSETTSINFALTYKKDVHYYYNIKRYCIIFYVLYKSTCQEVKTLYKLKQTATPPFTARGEHKAIRQLIICSAPKNYLTRFQNLSAES